VIEHVKAVTLAIPPAVLGVVAAMLPWLNDLRTLLVVVSLLVAMATGLLGLWFRKLIRDREDERLAIDEKRESRLREQVDEIRKESAALRELLTKLMLTHETLSKDVLRVSEEVKRAHLRLDTGNEKFHDLELRMARRSGERRLKLNPRDDDAG